jgi:hypothetical protein
VTLPDAEIGHRSRSGPFLPIKTRPAVEDKAEMLISAKN